MDEASLRQLRGAIDEALGDGDISTLQDQLLKEVNAKQRKQIIAQLSAEVQKSMKAQLSVIAEQITADNEKDKQQLIAAFKEAIKQAWTVKLPTINVPKPEVTVNVPAIKVPEIKAPSVTVQPAEVNIPPFPDTMTVPGLLDKLQAIYDVLMQLLDRPEVMGEYHNGNPLPVQLIDLDGKAYKARGGGSFVSSTGGNFETPGVPVGYLQMTVSTAAVGITDIPDGATRAVVTVENDTIRWRDDGTAPTNSVGMPAVSLQSLELPTSGSIANFQAIRDANATGDVLLNISFYKR